MSLSANGYAQHRRQQGLRGTSHVAVIKAIESGRLSAPAVRRDGTQWVIDAELADQQWSDRTNPSAVGLAPPAPEAAVAPVPRAVDRPAPSPTWPPAPAPAPAPTSMRQARSKPPDLASAVPPLSTSKAIAAAYDAKLKQLEYQRAADELLPARQVKGEAFALGRALRDSLMRLADRLAPTLAAASDARQVHHLLTEEIRIALRSLNDG